MGCVRRSGWPLHFTIKSGNSWPSNRSTTDWRRHCSPPVLRASRSARWPWAPAPPSVASRFRHFRFRSKLARSSATAPPSAEPSRSFRIAERTAFYQLPFPEIHRRHFFYEPNTEANAPFLVAVTRRESTPSPRILSRQPLTARLSPAWKFPKGGVLHSKRPVSPGYFLRKEGFRGRPWDPRCTHCAVLSSYAAPLDFPPLSRTCVKPRFSRRDHPPTSHSSRCRSPGQRLIFFGDKSSGRDRNRCRGASTRLCICSKQNGQARPRIRIPFFFFDRFE